MPTATQALPIPPPDRVTPLFGAGESREPVIGRRKLAPASLFCRSSRRTVRVTLALKDNQALLYIHASKNSRPSGQNGLLTCPPSSTYPECPENVAIPSGT